MELTQLKHFHCAAQYENITKAAEILHITAPALSKSIRNLEDELNLELFFREGKRIHLNKYGKCVKKYTEYILNNVDFMISELGTLADQKEPKTVRVATISDGIMWPIVPMFAPVHRDIQVKWDVLSHEELEAALLSNSYDISFSTAKISNSKISSTVFTEIRPLVSVPKSSHLSAKRRISAKDLVNEEIIWFETDYRDSFRDFLYDDLKKNGVKIISTADANIHRSLIEQYNVISFISNFSEASGMIVGTHAA